MKIILFNQNCRSKKQKKKRVMFYHTLYTVRKKSWGSGAKLFSCSRKWRREGFNLEKDIRNLWLHLHDLPISRWLSRLPILDAKGWMEQAESINRKQSIKKGIRSVRETLLRSADEIAAEKMERWKKERLKRGAGEKVQEEESRSRSQGKCTGRWLSVRKKHFWPRVAFL